MAFIQSDPTLDLTTAEGRRAQLKALLAARAEEGAMPRGDIEVLETEFSRIYRRRRADGKNPDPSVAGQWL